MSYRDNVQALCDRLGLPNPIREEDVLISSVRLLVTRQKAKMISLTNMNRAGMVFLQEQFSVGGLQIESVGIGETFKKRAREHFAELWDDAEEKKRTLIMALKPAVWAEIEWQHWMEPT